MYAVQPHSRPTNKMFANWNSHTLDGRLFRFRWRKELMDKNMVMKTAVPIISSALIGADTLCFVFYVWKFGPLLRQFIPLDRNRTHVEVVHFDFDTIFYLGI